MNDTVHVHVCEPGARRRRHRRHFQLSNAKESYRSFIYKLIFCVFDTLSKPVHPFLKRIK